MTETQRVLSYEEAHTLYRAGGLPDDLTPQEKRWHAEDPRDPRPYCPNRAQHAVVLYGARWNDCGYSMGRWPRLDGKSVQRTHKQLLCLGCHRYCIWEPHPEAEDRPS